MKNLYFISNFFMNCFFKTYQTILNSILNYLYLVLEKTMSGSRKYQTAVWYTVWYFFFDVRFPRNFIINALKICAVVILSNTCVTTWMHMIWKNFSSSLSGCHFFPRFLIFHTKCFSCGKKGKFLMIAFQVENMLNLMILRAKFDVLT